MGDLTKFSQSVFAFTKQVVADSPGVWSKSWSPADHQIIEVVSIYCIVTTDATVGNRYFRVWIGATAFMRLWLQWDHAIVASEEWHINLFPGATEQWGAPLYRTAHLSLPPGQIFYPGDGIAFDLNSPLGADDITQLTVSGKLWTL
jgi:hypothetical protein